MRMVCGVALAGMVLWGLPVPLAQADGIQIGVGDIQPITIAPPSNSPAPLPTQYWAYSLSVPGELYSYLTAIRDTDVMAGYRVMSDASVSGFVLDPRKMRKCSKDPLACEVYISLVEDFGHLVISHERVEALAERSLAWHYQDQELQISIPDSPLALVADSSGVAELCGLEQPASLDAFLAGLVMSCSPVGDWLLANDAPGVNAFVNAGNWFAVNAADASARVIDASVAAPVAMTLDNIARVFGINDANQVIGITTTGGAPQLHTFDGAHNAVVTALPVTWAIVNDTGTASYTVSFAAVRPVAINNAVVILRVSGYDAANLACAGVDCVAPLPVALFAERSNDIFYCKLTENCATAYPLGGTAVGSDVLSALISGAAMPKVQASAESGYLLGNDGILVGHHDRGFSEEPFLVSIAEALPTVVYLADLLQSSGWRELRVTGRNASHRLSGHAVQEGATEPSAVVFLTSEPVYNLATAAPVVAAGGGGWGVWGLLILSCVAWRRRSAFVRDSIAS